MTNIKGRKAFVSIIIPVYNVSGYIERCLNSVMMQTYKHIEVVIVNDCTPDDSMRKVKLFKDKNSKYPIRVVDHPKNLGLSASRNTGIKNAKGEYLYFLDSDDEITPECIYKLVNLIEKYDAEMVVGNYKAIPHNWFKFNLLNDIPNGEFIDDSSQLKKLFLSRNYFPVMAWNRLILKSFIEKHDLFFKEGIIHEDEHWNYFLAKYIKRLAVSTETTYLYYKNNEGIMRSSSFNVKSSNSWKIILKDFANNIDSELTTEQIHHIVALSYEMYNNSNNEDFEFIELSGAVLKFKWTNRLLSFVNEKIHGRAKFLLLRVIIKTFRIR